MSTAFPPMDLYLLDHPSIPMLPPDAYMPFSNINHNLFHLKYVYINNYFNLQFAFLDVLRAIYHDTLNDFSQIQSFHPQYINRFSRAQHQIGYNYNSPSFLPTNTMNTVTSNYIQEMLTNIHNMVDILNTSHTEGISALRNAVLYLDREAQRNAVKKIKKMKKIDRAYIKRNMKGTWYAKMLLRGDLRDIGAGIRNI